MKTCSIPECGGPLFCRTWCRRHYLSWWKHGDPVASKQKRPDGSGNTRPDGYVVKQSGSKHIFEHIRIAERALGKPLPLISQVHHVDENPSNNTSSNLVICPSQTYHMLLHQRTDALNSCGHADWRKCNCCKTYDDPENLLISKTNVHHRECFNNYQRARRKEKSL